MLPPLVISQGDHLITLPIPANWTGRLELDLNVVNGVVSRHHHKRKITTGRCADCGSRNLTDVTLVELLD